MMLIGVSCPICPATIAATSSMESGFCFCSANASRMAWNIAAVTASPGCSPLSMSFLISRRIARNTFLIFSISASCSPIFWAFKSCKSCFASARCSGCSFIRSDREAERAGLRRRVGLHPLFVIVILFAFLYN